MPRPLLPDLTAPQFKASLRELGFAYIPNARSYIDLRRKGAPAIEIPAGAVSRALKRRETIGHLLFVRGRRNADDNAAAAVKAEQERVAATIAPQAITPPRDSLEGAAAVAALADDFIILTTRAEGAALKDLRRLGWRKAQIFEHADAARAVAAARQGGVMA